MQRMTAALVYAGRQAVSARYATDTFRRTAKAIDDGDAAA